MKIGIRIFTQIIKVAKYPLCSKKIKIPSTLLFLQLLKLKKQKCPKNLKFPITNIIFGHFYLIVNIQDIAKRAKLKKGATKQIKKYILMVLMSLSYTYIFTVFCVSVRLSHPHTHYVNKTSLLYHIKAEHTNM